MKLIRAILLLPFPVVIVIPGMILWFAGAGVSCSRWNEWRSWIALLSAFCGIALAVSTMRLFVKCGRGTPAPWDPPEKLVVSGAYCHVRNPMLTGVWLLLFSEALFFQSWGIGVWLVFFIVINMIYFPMFEEPGLRKRFGGEYEEYCRNVPRYFPRMTPWRKK